MAAEAWVDRLFDAAERLVDFPNSGRVVPEVRDVNLRELLIGEYRAIYRVVGEEVRVLTVRHGRRLFDGSELNERSSASRATGRPGAEPPRQPSARVRTNPVSCRSLAPATKSVPTWQNAASTCATTPSGSSSSMCTTKAGSSSGSHPSRSKRTAVRFRTLRPSRSRRSPTRQPTGWATWSSNDDGKAMVWNPELEDNPFGYACGYNMCALRTADGSLACWGARGDPEYGGLIHDAPEGRLLADRRASLATTSTPRIASVCCSRGPKTCFERCARKRGKWACPHG